jgi:hypothetical protein
MYMNTAVYHYDKCTTLKNLAPPSPPNYFDKSLIYSWNCNPITRDEINRYLLGDVPKQIKDCETNTYTKHAYNETKIKSLFWISVVQHLPLPIITGRVHLSTDCSSEENNSKREMKFEQIIVTTMIYSHLLGDERMQFGDTHLRGLGICRV